MGTNWHVITNRLPVKALSTRVSFLIVKFWLRLHQRNILKAAKSLWALRRILISWKILSLAFQRLLMQYTVQFALLNQLRRTFFHKSPQCWNDFFPLLLIKCLMFAEFLLCLQEKLTQSFVDFLRLSYQWLRVYFRLCSFWLRYTLRNLFRVIRLL